MTYSSGWSWQRQPTGPGHAGIHGSTSRACQVRALRETHLKCQQRTPSSSNGQGQEKESDPWYGKQRGGQSKQNCCQRNPRRRVSVGCLIQHQVVVHMAGSVSSPIVATIAAQWTSITAWHVLSRKNLLVIEGLAPSNRLGTEPYHSLGTA